MSEPEEVQFACIGCGTFNPATAEVCSGCGHNFAGHDVVSKVRVVLPPRLSENQYEPPSAPIAPPRTFRIGSVLAWIALIAVCLGAFRENIGLGIMASLSFIPPAIWTSFRSGQRRVAGRPMNFEVQAQTFLLAMGLTWGILLSCSIAFCATCIGAAIVTNNASFGFASGTVVGVGCAAWFLHLALKASRERIRREREIRYLGPQSEDLGADPKGR